MSWNLLKRFIESDHFNNDPFLSVSYLARYADHVGIHYVLCSKLRQFSYEEIEFFLPQLCHLLISLDNQSMALEEFIIDLCEESVNGALLTFWLFQTYLHDLSSAPHLKSFRTCQRIYNKVQRIIFGLSDNPRGQKINDNVLPVSVLASLVLSSVATPFLPRFAGPLAIAQARKPRYEEETFSDTHHNQGLSRSNTIGPSSPARINRDREVRSGPPTPLLSSSQSTTIRPKSPRSPGLKQVSRRPNSVYDSRPSVGDPRLSSSSLPDIRTSRPPVSPALRPGDAHQRRHSHRPAGPDVKALSRSEKVGLLKSNYFRCETQFLAALEDISNRLVAVPKPARLSALRAELALITQDLPAEVDIPVICPAHLPDGSPSRSKHHRVVRLNPAEATVLNSAERVPYLLMVEVLEEDFDFDPDSGINEALLAKLLSKPPHQRRLFDLSADPQYNVQQTVPSEATGPDSVFEPSNGDLGSSSLLHELEEEDEETPRPSLVSRNSSSPGMYAPRLSSGATTYSSRSTLSTPRTSDTSGGRVQSFPGTRKMTLPPLSRSPGPEQLDFSALATHMRTAAHMLAQLDSTGGKRPRDEVAAIKAKIIASMQNLEEQSFVVEENQLLPTFDTIIPNGSINHPAGDLVLEQTIDPALNASAGLARMENDQKTGGVERKGDRDDPSAATFGEEWSAKKERIRKTSPFGWMKSWDLISVIVKTGADLRQEAFACQLIQVCGKIFQDADVPVWIKRMRILVTGESSGLIETITNGVSLHSLKRSLTLALIASGHNPRNRIATLRDHFVKTFGDPDTESYKAGQDAFVRSLAAYSMICYILQLKDRHNGNILIDNEGHIIHIDFGFMLSNSPGSVGFEAAPFKLTHDYIEILGGVNSPEFDQYKHLCKQAFQALRKSADSIISLVDMMGQQSKMPCFASGVAVAVHSLKQRFQLHLSQEDAERFVETDLIGKSLGSYYTRLYDVFQYRSQGIY